MGLFGGKTWNVKIKYRIDRGPDCEDTIAISEKIHFSEGEKIREELAKQIKVGKDRINVYLYLRA